MRKTTITVAVLASAALLLSGCSKDPEQAQGALSQNTAQASAAAKQTANASLHDRLPDKIKKAGKIVSVNSGAFPPYVIPGDGGQSITGATNDVAQALGQILGVGIQNVTVDGLSGVLSGIEAGRYDFALGPIGDFPDREKGHDFVDWVQEFVVFAVAKGNPKHITGLDSVCGLRVAVMAGGSAEKVIKDQSQKCTQAGKQAIKVQSFKDQPTSVLSVRSGRADAFFSSQAPLSYFVQQSNGQLDLAATGKKNGFNDLFQGAVVPKDSPLGPVLLDAMKQLYDNGTYAKIMKKWHLDGNMIDAPGLNLASKG